MQRNSTQRPPIRCYSTDYEHSIEHWVAVRRLVETADQDAENLAPAPPDEKSKSESAA